MRGWTGAISAAALIAAAPTFAQDVPWRGSVTSVEQHSGLTFECAGEGGHAQCSFIQTMVSQESPYTEEQSASTVSQMIADGASAQLCADLLPQFEIIRGGGDFGVELTDRERADAIQYGDLLEALCADPGEATAKALLAAQEDRKRRTCKIGTLPFDISLTWNDQSRRWESVSSPEGGCGVVTMVFMEKDAEVPTFWNYREQTIVTNKTGTDPLRGECSAWPEEVQLYTWQPNTLRRVCEYVSFGF